MPNDILSLIEAFLTGLDPQSLWVLAMVSAVLGTLGFLPYIWDTVRQKTSPDRATWLIWTAMSGISFFSQLYEGADFSLYFSGTQFGATALIFLLSIRFGRGAYFSDSNVIIFFLAFCGLVTWYYTESAVYSLGISIGISMLGSLNTVRKAYIDPRSETLVTWIIGLVASLCGVISVGQIDWVLMAYPLYLTVLYALIVVAKSLGHLAGNAVRLDEDFVSDGRLFPKLEEIRVISPYQAVDLSPLAEVLTDKPRIAQAASNPVFVLSAVIAGIAICASSALTANFAWHLSDVEWLGLCLVFGMVSVNMMRPLLMANGVWWLSRYRFISGTMALTLAILLSPIAILASTSAVSIAVDSYSAGLTEISYALIQSEQSPPSANAYLKTVFDLLSFMGITGSSNRFFLPLLVSVTLELAILMGTGLLARRSAVS